MAAPSLVARLCSWRVLISAAAVTLALLLLGPHAWAWYQLAQARSALARYHPDKARTHLESCLRLWASNIEAHLLASRAARQRGEFEEADRELRTCQRLAGSTTDAIALEWALLNAAGGNLYEVEEFLQHRAETNSEQAPLVWEAVAEGYIRVYRILDALACLDHWLALEPDNLRALELRGLAFQNGKAASRGAENFRQVIVRDPSREATRWRLVLCLLDMGGYDEALPHLEYLASQKPDDPEVQIRQARCLNMLGHGDEARQVLDAVLARHPEQALALRTGGQFALADRDLARAESWLRRAVQVWPSDYESNWLLYQALQQQNRTAEAQAQLEVTQEVKDRAERLGELSSRKLSEQPLTPALHYEMGVLLIRSGHSEVGGTWLVSALGLDPDYAPAHRALAELYERRGDTKRAAEHRGRGRGN